MSSKSYQILTIRMHFFYVICLCKARLDAYWGGNEEGAPKTWHWNDWFKQKLPRSKNSKICKWLSTFSEDKINSGKFSKFDWLPFGNVKLLGAPVIVISPLRKERTCGSNKLGPFRAHWVFLMPKNVDSLSLFHTVPMNCHESKSRSRLSPTYDNCKNYDEVPGYYNLRSFLAANSTQNYFLICYVFCDIRKFFAAKCRRGWPYSNGHGFRNRLLEERVHPNYHGDNVTQGVYFKSQIMEMEEGMEDLDMEEEKE